MIQSLPAGWARANFGELLLDAQNGCGVRSGQGTPTVVLRLADVDTDGNIATQGLRVVGLHRAEIEKYLLRQGDLLVFRVNGSRDITGQVIRYRGPLGFTYCDHFIRFRMNCSVVDPEFVARAFKSGAVRRQVELSMVSSAGQNTVSQGSFRDVAFAIPPLNEQRRIVAKLDAVQARSRRAREALDAVPPLLEILRQSILAAAFRGDLTKDWRAQNPNTEPASALLARIRIERRKKWEESELAKLKAKGKPPTDDRWKAKYKEPAPVDTTGLPELPSGWCWAGLNQLAWDSGYGTSEKCGYEGAGVPVLRIPNIARGLIDLGDVKRALKASDTHDLDVAPGDLLIVRTNGSRDLIGRAAIVASPLPEPTSFASYLIRFRLLALGSIPAWVGRYWQSAFIRGVVEGHAASSAGQYNVSLGELCSCPVPLAPFSEQAAVLDAIEPVLKNRLAAERLATDTLSRLNELERAVLAKAFRGELIPQDPNDEPAEVMLARVRAEAPDSSPRRAPRSKAAE